MAEVAHAANGVDSSKSDDPTKQWQTFIQNSLRLRLGEDKFRRHVEELSDRFPIAGHKLAAIVVDSHRASDKIVDPRIPIFVEQLLESHIINSYDVLAALFREYSEALESRSEKDTSVYELETNLLDHLVRSFVSAKSPRSIPETRYALLVLSRWLESMTSANTDSDGLMHPIDHNAIVLYDSLGLLAIAMLENVRVSGVIEKAITPGRCLSPAPIAHFSLPSPTESLAKS
jgi:mediator of RNA polymerase II transcription subunit 5